MILFLASKKSQAYHTLHKNSNRIKTIKPIYSRTGISAQASFLYVQGDGF